MYGESKFTLVEYVVQQLGGMKGEAFLDVGSGVGQVCLAVSALSDCKTVRGIEKNSCLSGYARVSYFNRLSSFLSVAESALLACFKHRDRSYT